MRKLSALSYKDGVLETWKYQGGSFSSIGNWRKSEAVSIVHELGDSLIVAMSQQGVAIAFRKILYSQASNSHQAICRFRIVSCLINSTIAELAP